MPASIQDCIAYINAHIYENSNEEVSATEVKTAMLMMLEAMQSFIPKGEYGSDEAARDANLQIGDTYILTRDNDYGIGARGIQKTVVD